MSAYPITLGLEEEVFVLERGRLTPTLQSLDYMRRLLWSNPKRYSKNVASNFARGDDAKECLMGSVEISTGVHRNVDALIEDLVERRTEMARATEGALVVPVGSLFTLDAPSNTAGCHIHVKVPSPERARVFENLAYALPLFACASASSPYVKGDFFGESYRIARPHALGPLREDREYRFQDLIVTKRLGTIELRVLDPMPETHRIREVAEGIRAVAAYHGRLPFDRARYNERRESWAREGVNEEVREIRSTLADLFDFPEALLHDTMSKRLAEAVQSGGFEKAYALADHVWREPTETTSVLKAFNPMRTVTGLAGFYAVRLPYMAYKGIKEWKGTPP